MSNVGTVAGLYILYLNFAQANVISVTDFMDQIL